MSDSTNPIPIEVNQTVTKITVTVSTVSEAVEFAEKYSGGGNVTVQQRKGRPASPAFDGLFAALLVQLAKSSHGLDVEEVMDLLDIESSKAIGRKTYAIRRRLEALGLNFDEVVERVRSGNGAIWLAGPRIKEAIAVLDGSET